MAKGKDKNYVSIWFWMLAIFVIGIPCIGFIMAIVWAFTGENESRKNYFRAWLLWLLIMTALLGGVIALGLFPGVLEAIHKRQIRPTH